MEAFDVVVVGGGPAGAVAARTAARGGARVLLLERAPSRPLRCTGLVSPRFVDHFQVPPRLILRAIRGVCIVPPQGQPVELVSSQAKGYVLDRVGLDRWLLAQAEEAGVKVQRGVKATGLAGQVVHTSRGPVKFGFLIGADGPTSGVRRWAGFGEPSELLVGVQALVEGSCAPDKVEVHLGQRVAPGFLAWVVPAEEGILRVGLATVDGRQAAQLLQKFLRHRFPGASVVGWATGLIPLGPPQEVARGQVLLVGNAAAQVKPLTGGGLLWGMWAAQWAGQAVLQPNAACWYTRRWRGTLGQEVLFGLRARQVFRTLTDEQLEQLVSLLREPALARLLEKNFDLDFPARLVGTVLRRPTAWAQLARLLRTLGPTRALQTFFARLWCFG